ncbi:MAG: signal peptidase II [Deltaproteobacteria bacterium]|nr:signal peptidase II [Deltaproteobacteria bacterium]
MSSRNEPLAKFLWCLIPAALTLVLDLGSKALAVKWIDPLETLELAPFFNLVLAFNSGAAFSLFAGDGPYQGLMMSGIAALSMLPLIWFYRQARSNERGAVVSLGLVAGGALGNIVDRLRYKAVVDFLDFHWGPNHWPAFNLADAAICVGLGSLILFSLKAARRLSDSPSTRRGLKRKKERAASGRVRADKD